METAFAQSCFTTLDGKDTFLFVRVVGSQSKSTHHFDGPAPNAETYRADQHEDTLSGSYAARSFGNGSCCIFFQPLEQYPTNENLL